MRGRGRCTAGAVVVLCALVHAGPAAQEPIDHAMIAAIKAEGLERSEAATLFYTLTDVLGPRLTGSPAYIEAARWARDRFRDWGLATPRLEAFEFGRGWSLEQLTVEMVAPHYMPLIGYAEAWSPPTAGILTGTPQYVGDGTAEEIDRLGARLQGAIVLTHRPQVEFLRADRMEPSAGGGPVQTGNPPLPEPSSATPAPQMLKLLRTHGAGVEGIGSTDHVPFDQVGIPAFTAIKDFRNYDVRTRHTNADLADAVTVGDLQQSAVVLAAIAWHAAVRDEPIPRRRR
jgi:hypothetical protein